MANIEQIKASYELFDKLKCCSHGLNGNFTDDVALALIDEDKMRCHIMNCLAALSVVQIQRKTKQTGIQQYELLKIKVFKAACSMMMDTEFDYNYTVNTILSSFPDESKISDERNWLIMHFAMALFIQIQISAEVVHMLHTNDPLAMYRLSEQEIHNGDLNGFAPAHLLCMQKAPNMAMVRYFSLRDPKAFLVCDQKGRCALHLAAEYSESVELLQTILQIDQLMSKKDILDYTDEKSKPLGSLCKRLEFPTFHDMVACLIEVDSSVEVIHNGIVQCLESYRESTNDYAIYPGSRGEKTLILLRILIEANLNVIQYGGTREEWWIFHKTCVCLRGELGVAVLSLLLLIDSTKVKLVDEYGYLPIHQAVTWSCLDVVKLLLKAYPESLFILTNDDSDLLHLAFDSRFNFAADMRDKVEYICDQCPSFIHQKNDDGSTPLHCNLEWEGNSFDLKSVIYLCNVDETVVMDQCTHSDTSSLLSGWLPLHILIEKQTPLSEISDAADCFRLFLRIYPASAGVMSDSVLSPYGLAVLHELNVYFIRLLLNADPTIDPVRRHNLNFAARREAMFLAFRALTSNVDATIWAKLRYEHKDLLVHVISYL